MSDPDIVNVNCPKCERAYRVRRESVGKKAKCAACDMVFVIGQAAKKREQCPQCGDSKTWDGTRCSECGFPEAAQDRLLEYADEVLRISGMTRERASQLDGYLLTQALGPGLRQFREEHPELSPHTVLKICDAVLKRLGRR